MCFFRRHKNNEKNDQFRPESGYIIGLHVFRYSCNTQSEKSIFQCVTLFMLQNNTFKRY